LGQTVDDVADLESITIREAVYVLCLLTEIQYVEMGGMCD